MSVLLVTDPRWSVEHTAHVIREAGRVLGSDLSVQYRDKVSGLSVETARHYLRAACEHGSPFFVNGDPELADRLGAGCHVSGGDSVRRVRRLLPEAFLTAATHSEEDVRRARDEGADGVLVSPIFDTPGKGAARGLQALRAARHLAPALRIVALGGVDEERAASCRHAGADGVAVIRALLAATDPARAALALSGGYPSEGPMSSPDRTKNASP